MPFRMPVAIRSLLALAGARVVWTGLFAFAIGGCADASEPTFAPQVSRTSTETASVRPGEVEFQRISQLEPDFAGFIYEGERLVVFSTDVGRAESIKAAVEDELLLGEAAHPGSRGPYSSVEVRPAVFSFQDLSNWRDVVVEAVLDLPAVDYVDLDEARNRVTVGLKRGADSGPVEAALGALKLPDGAVGLDSELETVLAMAEDSLVQKFRPLPGGVIGLMVDPPNPVARCTIGFNATRNGEDVLVTNSHCSASWGSIDNRDIYNRYNTPSDWVAMVELVDPNFTTWCGGWPCRRADVSVYRHEFEPDSIDFGRIARTTWRASGIAVGSKEIDQSSPRFDIVAVDPYPSYGEFVNKMGIRTGWTMGSVTHTCIETNVAGHRLKCQYQAYYGSGGTDSGSPVFKWSGSGNDVTLTGLNWGAVNPILLGTPPDTVSVGYGRFSPFGGIDLDVGPLYVYPGHSPSPPSVYINSGPTILPGYVDCKWTSSASGGTPPYSFTWTGVASGTGATLTDYITSSGTLTVTVTDDNGLTDSDSWFLTRDDNEPLPPGCFAQ